jgi:hypothetical protein
VENAKVVGRFYGREDRLIKVGNEVEELVLRLHQDREGWSLVVFRGAFLGKSQRTPARGREVGKGRVLPEQGSLPDLSGGQGASGFFQGLEEGAAKRVL